MEWPLSLLWLIEFLLHKTKKARGEVRGGRREFTVSRIIHQALGASPRFLPFKIEPDASACRLIYTL